MLRNNIVVAIGTALSRVTGMLRVAVLGLVIGPRAVADAYNAANSSPNTIYELLLGGALSDSLVPLFSKLDEDKDDEGTVAVVSTALVAMIALTVVAVVAAPWIFHLYSLNPSDNVDAEQFRRVGTLLARIFLIQIFFYGLTSLGTSMLNARRRFFAAAWSPVLSNLIIIASLLMIPHLYDGDVTLAAVLEHRSLQLALGLGATLGIAAMALSLYPALRRSGAPLWFSTDFRHPAVKKLLQLSGWTLGYAAANQVAVVVIQNLALNQGEGRQDLYIKAFTFFVLPHGLLAVSIATTFEPEMARSVAARNKPAFIDRTSLGVRMVALLTIPAGFGLFVLRRPIIGVALQHGKFTAADALEASRALAGLALGLVGFSVYLFTLRAFYSHQDARTPFVINIFENLINIVLAIVLVPRYGILGLGLALAIAYLVSAAWALLVLSYKVSGFELRTVYRGLWPMAVAGLVMAEAVWFVTRHVGANSGLDGIVRVGVGAVVGIGVYVAMLVVLGVPELATLRERLPGRRR
ncbi:MAG TPA: murein biosynthesis integral membrane protein MurJ [Ilumatobacteraceae bacterium]|nr:murein biosynthesis integral membrane protein MurJ [Ilumatobacteraceae bacterium]